MSKHKNAIKLLLSSLALILGAVSQAEVRQFDVVSVESPAFDGRTFGDVGQYQKITAKATIAIDPDHELNRGIVDLDIAPVNADGLVEAVADVVILRPVDLAKGSGRIFYEVLNRGDKITFVLLNDAPWVEYYTDLEIGNGYLMREGYSIVWSGWQGDLPPGKNRMTLDVPVLQGVTGTVRDEIIFKHAYNPFVATLSYPAATLDPNQATLTVRARQTAKRATPDDLGFEFFYQDKSGIWPYTPDQIIIHRPQGFDASAIYEFTYEARDPRVMGLAFASVRDVVSFLRYDLSNDNPLLVEGKPASQFAYGMGISQSGRFVRDFIYQGFNEDERGRMVFDAVLPDVAGSRKTWTNFRFAQPGRYSREHESHLQPGDQFPFTYGVTEDHLPGKVDGILKRCQERGNCPKIIHTDTSTEFWQARASLVVTDTRGNDITLPDNVRAYLMSGTEHSVGFGGEPSQTAYCQNLHNPLHNGGPMRALLHSLDLWVRKGVEPPPSAYPSRGDGTLVLAKDLDFPRLPGVEYDGLVNGVRVTDYATFPPSEGAPYPVFVPNVDDDGNDIAGIRLPYVDVPLATYLGWNLTRAPYAKGALCSVTGSTLPFPATRAEREATGDSRLSVNERYSSHEDYVNKVTNAVQRMVDKHWLLEEDFDHYVETARIRDIGLSSQ